MATKTSTKSLRQIEGNQNQANQHNFSFYNLNKNGKNALMKVFVPMFVIF